MYRTDREN